MREREESAGCFCISCADMGVIGKFSCAMEVVGDTHAPFSTTTDYVTDIRRREGVQGSAVHSHEAVAVCCPCWDHVWLLGVIDVYLQLLILECPGCAMSM